MMNRLTDVVKNIIIINVIIYLGVLMTQQYSGFDVIRYFQLYSPISEKFIPVQLVTHMFMHSPNALSHLLFNMLSLFFLGPFVEQRIGARKFLIFYLACGFGAMALHLGIDYLEYLNAVKGIDPEVVQSFLRTERYPVNIITEAEATKIWGVHNVPVVGASGAIYGVIIAFAMFFPNTRLMLLIPPIPIKAKYLALALIAFDLFSGISGQKTGIAHFAHLGGALMGFLIVTYWKKLRI